MPACLSTFFLFSLSLTVVYFRWLRKPPEAPRMSPALLLMKMNFLLDIPLTFVRMRLIRSTCAATAITFWRKPCRHFVGIGTAQPASSGSYGRSLLQRVTTLWQILWLQALLRAASCHCAQGMSLWLPGPLDHSHFTLEVLTCGGLWAALCLLLVSSVKVCREGKAGLLGLADVSFSRWKCKIMILI